MKIFNKYIATKSALLVLLSALPFAAIAEKKTFQSANFYDFPAMTNALSGAGTLIRTRESARVNLSLNSLEAETAYTIWWVIFNAPENCAEGVGKCGVVDIFNPEAETAFFYGAGFVTGIDGNANVSTMIKAGKVPKGVDEFLPGGLQKGNGFKAEYLVALRTHGNLIPGMVADQIGSYFGACEINNCIDNQAVSFPPMN